MDTDNSLGYGDNSDGSNWNYYDHMKPWWDDSYNGKNMGWVCPKCGRAFSPWVQECPYCTVNFTITTWKYPESGEFTVNINVDDVRYL